MGVAYSQARALSAQSTNDHCRYIISFLFLSTNHIRRMAEPRRDRAQSTNDHSRYIITIVSTNQNRRDVNVGPITCFFQLFLPRSFSCPVQDFLTVVGES